MRGLSFGTRASSAPVAPSGPTIYTLTFGNVETTTQWDGFAVIPYVRLTVASSGGNGTTTSGAGAFGNGTDTVYSAEYIATQIQAELEAIVGAGLVTVAGSGTGESRVLEVTFDASLTVTSFTFAGSSTWKRACVLSLEETTAGVGETPPAYEVFSVYNAGPSSSYNFGESGGSENYIEFDGDGNVVSAPSVTGYSITGGGSGQSYVQYTADSEGSKADQQWYAGSSYGDAGSVVVDSQGSDGEPGAAEVQTLSCSPIPYEGSWSLLGNAIGYAEGTDVIGPILVSNFGLDAVMPSASGFAGLSDGTITFTWAANGEIDNTILNVLDGTLATPEITRSIS